MRVSYLYILAFLAFSCQSRHTVEDSLSGEPLNGPVKEVYESSYEAFEINGRVEKGEARRKSGIDLSYVQKYNEKGQLVEYAEYATSSGSLVYKSLMTYHEWGGKALQESIYPASIRNTSRRFIYDDNQLLIEVNYYDASGDLFQRITNTYNDKNLRTIQRCFRSDGSLKWQYTYLYDSEGHVVEEVRDEDGQQFNYTTVYVYSRKGHLIEEIYKDAAYSFNKRYIYKYDKKGQKILDMSYNGSGELQSRIAYEYNDKHLRSSVSEMYAGAYKSKDSRFEYRYDRMGNWIERTEYIDNIVAYIVTREIVYFE